MRQNKLFFARSKQAALASLALGLLTGLFTASAAAEDKLTGDRIAGSDGDLVIHPINHATFLMACKDKTIYIDPVGGAKRFDGLPHPDLILVTDIHGDHSSAETLEAVADGAVAEGIQPQPRSGRQELIENILGRYI